MVSILEFLENKSILVIGGAGFLSKILVEKILRTQPNMKKLYLLIRAEDKQSANLRLQNEVTFVNPLTVVFMLTESGIIRTSNLKYQITTSSHIIGKELFKVLKEKIGESYFSDFIKEKVVTVPGDISFGENLGVRDDTLKQEMRNNLDVIFNLAATTRFDERYDISLNINTIGAKYVLEFSKTCTNMTVLVHVSTAYVCGKRTGLILESPYNMGDTMNGKGGLDIEKERRLLSEKLDELQAEKATHDMVNLTMKNMGMQRAMTFGWPNVYAFTKALGEMMITRDIKGSNLRLVIIRPSIVLSTFKEPFPGWIEGVRTVDTLIVGYGKGKITGFPMGLQDLGDTIPADMVINAIIVAASTNASREQPYETMIYHTTSSKQNPLKYTQISEFAYNYFSKYPWTNKNGKSIFVNPPHIYNSITSFRRYLTMKYLLPLKGLQVASIIFRPYLKKKYLKSDRKIKYVLKLISIYEPYLFFKGIFDDINTERLILEAKKSGMETDVFYFDPKVIDWENYFTHTHIPGLIKYVMK